MPFVLSSVKSGAFIPNLSIVIPPKIKFYLIVFLYYNKTMHSFYNYSRGDILKALICYSIIVNLYAFFLMYYDKNRAEKGKWRVPESKLFLLAIILGSPGIYLAMYTFGHKTKHKKFVIGIPAIFLMQIYMIYKLGLIG